MSVERQRQLGTFLIYGVCLPLVLLVLVLAVVFWQSVGEEGGNLLPMYLILISLAAGASARLGRSLKKSQGI